MCDDAASTPMQTPGGGTLYKPFLMPESPAPYSTFKLIPGAAPAPPSPAADDDDTDEDGGSSQSASPEGIFVSAEDVAALQQWAEDRETVNDRLRQAETMIALKEQEAEELRRKLLWKY